MKEQRVKLTFNIRPFENVRNNSYCPKCGSRYIPNDPDKEYFTILMKAYRGVITEGEVFTLICSSCIKDMIADFHNLINDKKDLNKNTKITGGEKNRW